MGFKGCKDPNREVSYKKSFVKSRRIGLIKSVYILFCEIMEGKISRNEETRAHLNYAFVVVGKKVVGKINKVGLFDGVSLSARSMPTSQLRSTIV